jgi:type IV pilus assembly protein PilA
MRNNRRGFTLIELVIVMAIIMILGAILYGPMNQHIMMAHETAAIEQIRTIHVAETQYYAQFGKYAASLAVLGPPATGATGPEAAGLIPKKLADGRKSGYTYAAALTGDGYAVTAMPEKFGNTGRRSFYSDQTLVVRDSWTAETANVTSAALE